MIILALFTEKNNIKWYNKLREVITVNKILILGSPGSGKSTFANKLGVKSNIPVLHLDTIFWKKNWELEKNLIFLEKLSLFMKQDQWIIDGNHCLSSYPQRFDQADTIILLNMNRLFCFFNAIKRVYQYRNKTRESMAKGCNEKMDLVFAKYILCDYPRTKKPLIKSMLNNTKNKQVFVFKNRAGLNHFLKQL